MIYMIALLLGSAILFYIGQPLRDKRYRFAHLPGVNIRPGNSRLLQQKNELLLAIRDIDLEYRMGKLNKDDYEKLKTDYQADAIRVLKKIDGKRDNGGNTTQPSVLQKPARSRPAYCTQCGTTLGYDGRFCSRCGKPVENTNGGETK